MPTVANEAPTPEGRPHGIMLAAGVGSRIELLSEILPKPLLPVCNRPIALYQLELMRSVGVSDIRIVVRPGESALRRFFGDGRRHGVSIDYVEQAEPLGIAHAVACALDDCDAILVCLGDTLIVPRGLERMLALLELPGTAAVLAARREPDPAGFQRDFGIWCASDGTVSKVVEKPLRPDTDLKGCGIYLFARSAFDVIRRTPKSARRGEHEITDSVQILVESAQSVRVAEAVDWDRNVTTPHDLLACNQHELARRGLTALVGDGAEIHPGARLEGTVVGERARIRAPIQLRDCVVLPDAVVDATDDVKRAIFAPGVVLNCASRP